jgi:hypothetical protein
LFVSGRCIGKRSSTLPTDADDAAIQELARGQHRWLVEAVREGFVDQVLNLDVAEELVVQLLGAQRVSGARVLLRFRVLLGGFVVGAAKVNASWKTESGNGELGSAVTNDAGVAELQLGLAEGAAELEVRAATNGQETVRRFLLKSAGV